MDNSVDPFKVVGVFAAVGVYEVGDMDPFERLAQPVLLPDVDKHHFVPLAESRK